MGIFLPYVRPVAFGYRHPLFATRLSFLLLQLERFLIRLGGYCYYSFIPVITFSCPYFFSSTQTALLIPQALYLINRCICVACVLLPSQ